MTRFGLGKNPTALAKIFVLFIVVQNYALDVIDRLWKSVSGDHFLQRKERKS